MYDTGSGYLTVASTTCDNCNPKYYDPNDSSTGTDTNITSSLNYGSASLTGEMYEDVVCTQTLNGEPASYPNDSCVNDFSFFLVTH